MILISERKLLNFIIGSYAKLSEFEYDETRSQGKKNSEIGKIREQATKYLYMIADESPMFAIKYGSSLNDIIVKANMLYNGEKSSNGEKAPQKKMGQLK